MEHIIDFLGKNVLMIYIVVLSIIIGIEVIGKVPSILHTPLMSGANAIHGVVLIGAIIVVLGSDPGKIVEMCIGFVIVVLGTLNVVGGFVVTDRMLEMFKKKKTNTKT
jgi:NAD(P) transhydrogenase subunit alpha